MGSQISHCHSILAEQVGEPLQLLQVSRGYPSDRLYDQHHRIGPSVISKAHQDQGGFPQRKQPAQASLSGHPERPEEMDDALDL